MKAADRDSAEAILRTLLDHAKTGTMEGIYERVRPGPDGRLRTSLASPGPISGRFSSRGTFLEPGSSNLQNLPKKTAKLDPLYNVRSCLVPDPGRILVEADFARAELYAYLAFAGDWDKLQRLIDGEDLHSAMGAQIYEVEPAEVDKSDPRRIIGKFANFSLGYGCGWKTFRKRVNSDADLTGVTIDAATSKKAVEVWRGMNSKTVRWWKEIEEEVRSTGRMENPFGRVRVVIDRSGRDVNSWISWKPQSTVGDALNAGLRRVWESLDPDSDGSEGSFELLLQVHDSVVGQVPAKGWRRTVRRVRDLMNREVEINGRRVPIPVEVEVSSRSWADVSEVEV